MFTRVMTGLILLALPLFAGCGDSSEVDASTRQVTTAPAPSPTVTGDYVAQTRQICIDGQQQVGTAINSVLQSEQFPSSFPSPVFARFYRATHGIGTDVLARLRSIPPPAQDVAAVRRELARLQEIVDWTSRAGRAVAERSSVHYKQLVATPLPALPVRQVLPQECGSLSLGPGAEE